MELPEINQRIKQIIDEACSGNVSEFSRRLGFESPQKINRLFKVDPRTEKYPLPSTEIVISISNEFENADPNWLLFGTKKEDKPYTQPSIEDRIATPEIKYGKNSEGMSAILNALRLLIKEETAPLFESLREDITMLVERDMRRKMNEKGESSNSDVG